MKKLFRRTITLLLCAVLLLGMVPAAQTTITLWTYPVGSWGDPEQATEIVNRFTEDNPDIVVNVEFLTYAAGDEILDSVIHSKSSANSAYSAAKSIQSK